MDRTPNDTPIGTRSQCHPDSREDQPGKEINALIADLYTLHLVLLACISNTAQSGDLRTQRVLDEQLAAVERQIASLVDRARVAGYLELCGSSDLACFERLGSSNLANPNRGPDLEGLVEDSRKWIEYLHEAHARFDAYGDVVTARLLTDLLEHAERRSFQLSQLAVSE
jgi:DNA-binding ferritin-like protein